MTAQGLAFISDSLEAAGINYSFQEWSGNVVYPYFVGDYIESSSDGEKGETQSRFILTGTTNSSWLSLEAQKEKLREIFPETGKIPGRSRSAGSYNKPDWHLEYDHY